MPFIVAYVLVAGLWPFGLAAFFEWNLNPAEWGWYTRLALIAVYSFFGWVILRALDAMKRSYYGT